MLSSSTLMQVIIRSAPVRRSQAGKGGRDRAAYVAGIFLLTVSGELLPCQYESF